MKKLIVLFGPENSGKTTTLKIAYELTKRDNLEETKWFKYYDDQKAHNDFRDVLILEQKVISKINNQDIKSQYFIINEDNQDDIIKEIVSFVQNTINSDVEIKDKEGKKEEDVKKIEWSKLNDLKNKNEETHSPEKRPNELVPFIDKYKVAFVLEGDYGFTHHNTQCSYPKLNLYTHLKNVEICDAIVCACSVVKKTGIKYQPLSCLILFILDCLSAYKSIQVYMIYNAGIKCVRKLDKTVWTRRNTRNQMIGKLIHSLI